MTTPTPDAIEKDGHKLHPDHLADLQKSGLTSDTIEKARLYTVQPEDRGSVLRACNFQFMDKEIASILAFPYLNKEGVQFHVRYKVFIHKESKGLMSDGKKIPKYLAPKGSTNRLYIPPGVFGLLQNENTPLYITEGEKKALALTQAGFSCIGISGLWAWKVEGVEKLIPDFDMVLLMGREIIVIPDNDYIRPDGNLEKGVWRLCEQLLSKGAMVYIIDLPAGKEKGIDDYLCQYKAEGFKQLEKTQFHLVATYLNKPAVANSIAGNDTKMIKYIERRVSALSDPTEMGGMINKVKKMGVTLYNAQKALKFKLSHPEADSYHNDPVSDCDPSTDPFEKGDSIVERYNKEYAILQSPPAIMYFQDNRPPELIKEDGLKLHKEHEYLLISSDKGQKKAFKYKAWLCSQGRRTYKYMGFDPKGESEGFYNLWKGFPIQPNENAGTFKIFRDHIERTVCQNNPKYIKYVWDWIAQMIQYPYEKPGVALCLIGVKGCGKTVVGDVLAVLTEGYYFTASKESDVTGDFNSHLATTILLQSDETVFFGNHKNALVMQNLITCVRLPIHRKYKDINGQPPLNYVRLLITSEDGKRVVMAGEKERRYAMLRVADTHSEDENAERNAKEYFKSMFKELEANNKGGYAALMHFLATRSVDETLVRFALKTEVLAEQRAMNFGLLERYTRDLITRASIPVSCRRVSYNGKIVEEFDAKGWKEEGILTPKHVVHSELLKGIPQDRQLDERIIGKRLKKLLNVKSVQKTEADGSRPYYYSFPPISEATRTWEKELCISIDEDDTNKQTDVEPIPESLADDIDSLHKKQLEDNDQNERNNIQ